jgi:hypothetical protein
MRFLCVPLFLCLAAPAQTPEPRDPAAIIASGQSVGLRQVHIDSRWGGLGTPAASELMIVKQGSGFRLGHRSIAPELLGSLVTALKEPDIPELNLANLGINQEWLVRNHEGPLSRYEGGPEVRAQNQQALYRERFDDPAFIFPLLSRIYRSGFHTDDYPSVRVQLTFEDGSIATLSSNSQQPFMLPWKVELGVATHITYNANISRALAAMLPTKTVNRPRISGEGLLDILRTAVDRALEPELNLLDADNRATPALAELRQHYSVVESEINEFHHPEYGTEWSGNQPHETNLHATLTRSDLPQNVAEVLVLEYKDGKVEGVEAFLSSVNKYERLLLSIPWLTDYIREHDTVPIRISYVHNASFGDKSLKVFAGDMHALGRDDLIEEARIKRSGITLLITGITYAESYWLIFPDKHMILWRYNGPSGLLKWKPSDFRTAECADYGVPFGGCVGANVDSDGNLTP